MNRVVTKEELISYIKEVDTRCKTWNEEKFNRAIVNGFAYLGTLVHPFNTVYFEDLEKYYQSNELIFDVNLFGSVQSIYDMYLAKRNYTDEQVLEKGTLKVRDTNRIWKDPSKNDVVHVDLSDQTYGLTFDYVEVKYFYLPVDANFDEYIMPSEVYPVVEIAILAAVFGTLKDYESETAQLNRAKTLAAGIPDIYPNDFCDDTKPSMFPSGI